MYWGIAYRYRYRSNFRFSFSFRFRTGRRQSGSTHDSDHAECSRCANYHIVDGRES